MPSRSKPPKPVETDTEPAARPRRKVKEAFNKLTPQEWTRLSRNVWDDVSSPRGKRQTEHGAVFPVKLAERLITLYSAPGDAVFDPFLGIGSTAIAAQRLSRHCTGIELNPHFAGIARDWIAEEANLLVGPEFTPTVINDDCRTMGEHLEPESVQVTVTSPPYADFIHRSVADRAKTHKKSRIVKDNNSRVKAYSDDPRDFGNLAYDTFLEDSEELFTSLYSCTRPGGYAVWVVKDYRLPPQRPYISMHSDVARVAERAGWRWHDLIVWNQNEQRRLVLLGFPSKFYTNQNCSFLVVLRKDG